VSGTGSPHYVGYGAPDLPLSSRSNTATAAGTGRTAELLPPVRNVVPHGFGNGGRRNVKRIRAATEILTYKWHPAILYTVHELDGAGYSELEAAIDDISSKMLSDGLSDLCERDILATAEPVEDSGRTIYVLTDKGRGLVPAIEVLDAWNQRYETPRSSVLILEDERMVADMLADYFSGRYDAQYVRYGEDALDAYGDDIDIVIIDRNLERMSGDEVAARIRDEDGQALLLCVSGVEPADDIYELAYDDYIYKPAGEDQMRARIELLLNRAELEGPVREYLALRSKQAALRDAYGEAATRMGGYRDCADRIEALDLSTDRRRTLDPLLPPGASEPLLSDD
jgi:DNA-binding HxlR family transcriptional regulator/DNA-binding response OmpR family regulator